MMRQGLLRIVPPPAAPPGGGPAEGRAEGRAGSPCDLPDRPLEATLAVINAAARWVAEGMGSPETIDALVRVDLARPLGPLALADQLGLDLCVEAMERLHGAGGRAVYRPCTLLRDMVRAGLLGCKVGKGFYDYPASQSLDGVGQIA